MINEIEKKFINLLLKDHNFISKAINKVDKDCFTNEYSKWFYGLIVDHFLKYNTGVSKTVVKNALNETFKDNKLQEYTLYIRECIDINSVATDFDYYIDTLLNNKIYRKVLLTIENTVNNITRENVIQKLKELENGLYNIYNSSDNTKIKNKDFSIDLFDRLRDLNKSDTDTKGIPTPISCLNETIGGLKKTHLIVIAAPSGAGKSQVLTNFAYHAYKLNKSVLFITLEMSYEDLLNRYYSLITNIDYKKIYNNTLTNEERKLFYYRLIKSQIVDSDIDKLRQIFKGSFEDIGIIPTKEEELTYGSKAKEKSIERLISKLTDLKFRNNKFIILDSLQGLDLPQLRTQIKVIFNRSKIDLIVIDYLNLLHSGLKGLKDWEEAKMISRVLKQLAREFEVPILTACQLHSTQSKNERLTYDDIRYSKAIAENSDFVIAFRRNERDEMMGIIRLELIKHRHSERVTIPIREKFKTMGIEEIIEPYVS